MDDKSRISINLGGSGLVLSLVFVILKVAHIIDWGWVWIFAPIWVPIALAIGILLIYLIVVLIIGLIAVLRG